MGTISQSATLHYAKKSSSDKHSSLLGPYKSYEENEVLWIQLQNHIHNTLLPT